MRNLPNIERSAFRHAEYVGYDCNGEVYHIRRDGPRRERGAWWVYPQTPGGIPCFYVGTLAVASIRLERRQSTSALPRLPHEASDA